MRSPGLAIVVVFVLAYTGCARGPASQTPTAPPPPASRTSESPAAQPPGAQPTAPDPEAAQSEATPAQPSQPQDAEATPPAQTGAASPPQQTGQPAAAPQAVDLGPEVPLPYSTEFASAGDLKTWKVYDVPQLKPSQWEVTKDRRLTELVHGVHLVVRNDGLFTHDHTHATVGARSWKNYEVQVTIRRGLSAHDNAFGVLFGYQGPERHYRLTFDMTNSDGAGGSTRLERRDGDRYTILANFWEVPPDKVFFRARVAFAFGRVVVWVNDRQVFNIEEAAIPDGKAGVFVGGSEQIEFAKFSAGVVTDPAPLAPKPINVLSGRTGTGTIYINYLDDEKTSSRQGGMPALIDEPLFFPDKTDHTFWERYFSYSPLPYEAVFRFPRGSWVKLDQITFVKQDLKGQRPQVYPRQVEVWISRTSPLDGFTRLGNFALSQKVGEESFPLRGAVGRYLKLRILSNHGAEEVVALNEVRAIGMLFPAAPDVPAVIKEEADLQESESNDTVQAANALPLGKTLAGALSADSDKDVFKVTVPQAPGDSLRLTVDARSFAAPELVVADAQGKVIDKIGPDRLGRRRAEFFWKLPPGDYWITVTRPPASMVLLVDDSDSMVASLEQTQKVLAGYLDRLAGKVAIKLIRYDDQPESLTEFTNDPAVLRKALATLGKGTYTDAFAGFRAGYGALADRPGNRVLLWLFDEWRSGEKYVSDWQNIFVEASKQAIRLYVMGVLPGWANYDELYALTEGDKAVEMTEIAGGRFLFAPTDREIPQIADRILADLTGPTRYALRADRVKSPPGIGTVEVKFAPDVQAINRNLEIILDASGSMNAKLGSSTRWAVAKKVLTNLVRQLPADINVSLRVFGHRKGGPASCQDTELLIPPGRVAPQAIIDKVNALKARGETPLVANLLLAGRDLAASKAGTVVAITDGEESCKGNVQTVATQLRAQGVHLVVNIVGFNLPNAKAIADWKSVAQSTGGRFFDAKTAGDLSAALRAAIRLEYVVYDQAGNEAGKALVGQALKLPEGTYALVVRAGQPVKVEGVKVGAGESAAFVLRREVTGWSLGPVKAGK